MRVAAFTLDVDRDVNLPAPGKKEACSKCPERDRLEARFSSSAKGLCLAVDLLSELGIRATFFLEGETLIHLAREMDVRKLLSRHEVACHGVCHEDITGESTGLPLTGWEISEMLDRSKEIVKEVFSLEPQGFRAPYQHIDQRTLYLLHKKGFAYDSSFTRPIDDEGSIRPFKVAGELLEIPLASAMDLAGRKIVSYLWPMHEGRRAPEDYRRLAASVHHGVLVLATHSWHLVETYNRGILDEASTKANLHNLRRVLQGVREEGMEFLTMQEIAEAWKR
ncbi:MAG: polysaccharide deacetylase family protein [Methanomassiliicoccales archaeon]